VPKSVLFGNKTAIWKTILETSPVGACARRS
jgi:hypothetical protein